MTVQEEVREQLARDAQLVRLRKKIESGKATYTDTAAYSIRAGKLLGEIFSRRLPEIQLEEREQLCVDLLHDQYIDINAAVDTVQRFMDEAQGLYLAPQHAPFDAERGHQIGSSLRDLSKPLETLQRRAKAAPETAVKAIHDDRMKAETKFRHKAGLDCRITRVAVNGCCPWCSDVAGRYVYGEEPDDIYRRHDNCDCTVTFENGRKRQDVWSKREWEAPEPGAGAGERVVLTEKQAAELEALHSPMIPSESGISGKQHTRTGENTVDLGMLHSDEYKRKFNGITGNSAVDRQLYAQAVAQLTHRNGTYMEDMVLIDSTTGEIAGRQSQSKTETGVDYNSSLKNAIKSHAPFTLISMHNHPTNNPPTGSDLVSNGARRYALGIVVTHNGRVFTYKAGSQIFSARTFDETVDKKRGIGYNEVDAIIETLREFSETYGIEWSER